MNNAPALATIEEPSLVSHLTAPPHPAAPESLPASFRSQTHRAAGHPAGAPPPLCAAVASEELNALKQWCLSRAEEWYQCRSYAAAREFLQNAVEIDPQDAAVWIALGSLSYELGEFAEAGLAFARAATLKPADTRSYLQLALSHERLGQSAQAEAVFRHALALQPDDALALNLFGGFLLAHQRFDEARECFTRQLLQQPDDIELLLKVGLCCFRLNDAAAAQRCYERVLQIDPANAVASENLKVIRS